MSILLDGTNDYLGRADTCGVTAYPFTFACWIKADTYSNQTPMSFGDTDAASFERIYIRDPADNDVLIYSLNAGTGEWQNTAQYTTGTWHHVCAVFAANNDRRIFIDGENKATTSDVLAISAALDNFCIGITHRDNGYIHPFDGRIAEAAIWDVALSDANVLSLGNGATPSGIDSGNLVSYWSLFDDGVDSTASNDLTAYNGASYDTGDHPTMGVLTISGTCVGAGSGSGVLYVSAWSIVGTCVGTGSGSGVLFTSVMPISGTCSGAGDGSGDFEIVLGGITNWPGYRAGVYDEDECWDEDNDAWVAINTLDINELGGAIYRRQIVMVGEQGDIYIGDV